MTGSGLIAKQRTEGVGAPPRVIGSYALFAEIAAGGMGVVHLGRKLGGLRFEPVVAIKRAHSNMAADPESVAMFREEIRLLSRIQHANVPAALDVVEAEGELLLVMEYVHGQALSELTRRARDFNQSIPVEICVAIACGVLDGLQAAHQATGTAGELLGIVHRDVSPQNVLVGCDGLARVLDFGVAKARTSSDVTRSGHVKGKLGYIAPEHILGKRIDCRADVYGVAVLLWEMLASARLFGAKRDAETVQDILAGNIARPSVVSSRQIPAALEDVLLRGLATDPAQRFASALEMSNALQLATSCASPGAVADWVTLAAHAALVERSRQLAWAENCPLFSDNMAFSSDAAAADLAPPASGRITASIEVDAESDLTVFDARFGRPLLGDADPWRPVATQPIATQPIARRNVRSIERARLIALYMAAAAAAFSMSNRVSHGALAARLRGYVPHHALAAPAPIQPSTRLDSVASASTPPIDAPIIVIPAPTVELATLPTEGDHSLPAKVRRPLPIPVPARRAEPVRMSLPKPKTKIGVDGF